MNDENLSKGSIVGASEKSNDNVPDGMNYSQKCENWRSYLQVSRKNRWSFARKDNWMSFLCWNEMVSVY